MVDPIQESDEAHPSHVDQSDESPPKTPAWVIVLGIVAAILILAFVAQFVLGIQHGPGMHG